MRSKNLNLRVVYESRVLLYHSQSRSKGKRHFSFYQILFDRSKTYSRWFFFFKTKKFQCSTSSWVNINTFKNNLFTKNSFFDWKYVRCLKKNITFEILLVSTFIPYTKFSSFRDIFFFFFFLNTTNEKFGNIFSRQHRI